MTGTKPGHDEIVSFLAGRGMPGCIAAKKASIGLGARARPKAACNAETDLYYAAAISDDRTARSRGGRACLSKRAC